MFGNITSLMKICTSKQGDDPLGGSIINNIIHPLKSLVLIKQYWGCVWGKKPWKNIPVIENNCKLDDHPTNTGKQSFPSVLTEGPSLMDASFAGVWQMTENFEKLTDWAPTEMFFHPSPESPRVSTDGRPQSVARIKEQIKDQQPSNTPAHWATVQPWGLGTSVFIEQSSEESQNKRSLL